MKNPPSGFVGGKASKLGRRVTPGRPFVCGEPFPMNPQSSAPPGGRGAVPTLAALLALAAPSAAHASFLPPELMDTEETLVP